MQMLLRRTKGLLMMKTLLSVEDEDTRTMVDGGEEKD